MERLIAVALTGQSFVEELQRAWDGGDAVFPVDLRYPAPILRNIIESVAPAVVVDSSGRHKLENGKPVRDGDALVVATSGTSGNPKAAVLTHEAVLASALLTSEAVDAGDYSSWLACLPLAHIGGLSVVTRALLTGTELIVHDKFEPEAAMNSGATHVSLVTAALRRIDPARFEKILLGGGPAPPDKPSNAITTYGMTETGSGIVYNGHPLPNVDLRIGRDNAIFVRSPTLFRGYRDGTTPIDGDGWFDTGDAGELASDATLTVFGRSDDVIITGGEKVWPAAVERLLGAHLQTSGVLITGEPDADWGERVVATIESTSPPALDEIRELVKAQLPAYCAPRELRIVERLGRTSSGKIIRPKNLGAKPTS